MATVGQERAGIIDYTVNGSVIENTCFEDEVRVGDLAAATRVLFFSPEAAIIIGSS